MKQFLKQVLLFLVCSILVSIIVAGVYVVKYKISWRDIPATKLSDSFSFNEKLEFIREYGKIHQPKILFLGSSVGLNNVYSPEILKHTNSETYLNTSSWGMTLQDYYELLKNLDKLYHPTSIYLVSTISEFSTPPKKIKTDLLKRYLTSSNTVADIFQIRYFSLNYLWKNMKYKKQVMADKHGYEYLVFDSCGTVNLDKEGFNIKPERWVEEFSTDLIPKSSYDYLDSISVFCKAHNLELVAWQSPIREGLYSKLSQEKHKLLNTHTQRVKNILQQKGFILIDGYQTTWTDSLFIDGEHMNTDGAKAFTEYCFEQEKKY